MTRKDLDFQARFFRGALARASQLERRTAINEMIHEYANECENQFANFNRERFLAASGAWVTA